MRYSEGSLGRVFILRLDDGEILHETIEAFAKEEGVSRASVTFLGGSADGSKVVVGPDATREDAIVPLVHELPGHREALAVGTLIPNEAGDPVLHMHAAAGREGDATVGCVRAGVEVWLVGEVIVQEILESEYRRKQPSARAYDAATGFALLDIRD